MRPQLLGRAIRSVLGQSYPHLEVHVYDNASGDETPQLVAQFAERDSRVKYHCHPQNIGLVRNIAFGMERVATPFVNILSDDDIVLPGFFESALRALADHSEAAMYMGQLLMRSPPARSRTFPLIVTDTAYFNLRRFYSKFLGKGTRTGTAL
jgi:glycosyltransferase involved in cell wall biosynthesis